MYALRSSLGACWRRVAVNAGLDAVIGTPGAIERLSVPAPAQTSTECPWWAVVRATHLC